MGTEPSHYSPTQSPSPNDAGLCVVQFLQFSWSWMTPNPSSSSIPGIFIWAAVGITVSTSPAAEVFTFLPRILLPSFFTSSFAFMVLWLCGQVEFPPAQLPKPLHKFSSIGPGQLLCLIGEL